MTTILSISYGRKLFSTDDPERRRLAACAETVEALHMVVFARRSACLSAVTEGRLSLHPTAARTRLGMLVAAYRIGSALLAAAGSRKGSWLISAQDPFEAGLVGWLLALRHGVPLRVEEHADFFGTPHWRAESLLNRLRYVFGAWLLRRASCVRTVSARARTHLRALGIPSDRIAVAPVAVELASFLEVGRRKREDAVREEVGEPPRAPLVLAVGRLVKQKDFNLLLRAFARVLAQGVSARLAIVGSGPEKAALMRRARRLGIAGQVSFVPWTDDVPSLMREADLFALPSRYEGWGRVVLEAMAAGLPGVVTEVGCAGEVFLDGRHGAVVPVADEDAFTAALARLLADASLRQVLGARASLDIAAYAALQPPYPQAWRAAFAPCLPEEVQKG